jgi:hypothetical protein
VSQGPDRAAGLGGVGSVMGAGGRTTQERSVIESVPVTAIRRRILLAFLLCRRVVLHVAEGAAPGILADGIVTAK